MSPAVLVGPAGAGERGQLVVGVGLDHPAPLEHVELALADDLGERVLRDDLRLAVDADVLEPARDELARSACWSASCSDRRGGTSAGARHRAWCGCRRRPSCSRPRRAAGWPRRVERVGGRARVVVQLLVERRDDAVPGVPWPPKTRSMSAFVSIGVGDGDAHSLVLERRVTVADRRAVVERRTGVHRDLVEAAVGRREGRDALAVLEAVEDVRLEVVGEVDLAALAAPGRASPGSGRPGTPARRSWACVPQ